MTPLYNHCALMQHVIKLLNYTQSYITPQKQTFLHMQDYNSLMSHQTW